MQVLRWGLLSTARINRRLIPSIRLSPRSHLAAVASRDPERGKQYADEWQIPHVFGSYEEMLASDQVDVVYVSLPNSLHAEWTIKALQAGKHVLCEKPFAVTLAEVDAMVAAAQTSGRILAEAFMYRHHPQTKLVLDLLTAGKIGEVRGIHSAFHFRLDQPANFRFSPGFAGGSLWDVGVYPISYSQMVFSTTPDWVMATQQTGPTGVDLTFFGMMHYPTGQVTQFTSSFDSPYHTNVEIVGTLGRLNITRPYNAVSESRIVLSKTDGQDEIIPVPQKDLYLGEVEDMEAAVLDGARSGINLQQSRDHVRIALALYRSAREIRPVMLE